MNAMTRTPASLACERGFTLVFAMLFLLIITVLGLSTMGTATMEERMARYSRDQNVAFQAAEAALRDGEKEILMGGVWTKRGALLSGATGFTADCGSGDFLGLCMPAAAGEPVWRLYLGRQRIMVNADKSVNPDKGVSYGQFTYAPADNAKPLDAPGANPPALPDAAHGGVAEAPKYLIEVMCVPTPGGSLAFGSCNKDPLYRVTALGVGGSNETQVLLQSVVRRPN